jgi:hypothetical protein
MLDSPVTAHADEEDADEYVPSSASKGKGKGLAYWSYTPKELNEMMDAEVKKVMNLTSLEVRTIHYSPSHSGHPPRLHSRLLLTLTNDFHSTQSPRSFVVNSDGTLKNCSSDTWTPIRHS